MMPPHEKQDCSNIDLETVDGFGQEWAAYDQSSFAGHDYDHWFDHYFGLFPFESLPPNAEGFDLGCGSGRWAAGVALRVGLLHCIDPAANALVVAQARLKDFPNIRFHLASSDMIPLADSSQDFGYSLGVLHHIPDTAQALKDCVRKLKIGAPFLVYIYYALENRPFWYRAIWQASDRCRRAISRMPFPLRKGVTTLIAAVVYWPLARTAAVADWVGLNTWHMPLQTYSRRAFYSMRTDALDRFGTKLEQRFSRAETQKMMEDAGLDDIRFVDRMPYWTACGIRRR